MKDNYRLILEDFEGHSSLSLEIFGGRIPHPKEMFHFDAKELSQEGDCKEKRNAGRIMHMFNGDYKVVSVSNENILWHDQQTSRLKVIARLGTKLTFS